MMNEHWGYREYWDPDSTAYQIGSSTYLPDPVGSVPEYSGGYTVRIAFPGTGVPDRTYSGIPFPNAKSLGEILFREHGGRFPVTVYIPSVAGDEFHSLIWNWEPDPEPEPDPGELRDRLILFKLEISHSPFHNFQTCMFDLAVPVARDLIRQWGSAVQLTIVQGEREITFPANLFFV